MAAPTIIDRMRIATRELVRVRTEAESRATELHTIERGDPKRWLAEERLEEALHLVRMTEGYTVQRFGNEVYDVLNQTALLEMGRDWSRPWSISDRA